MAVKAESIIINNRKFSEYISNDRIINEIERLGREISADFNGRRPLLVVILNGAFMFAADLVKELQMDVRITFIKVSSYEAMASSGNVKSLIGLAEDISGQDIILVEDIIDSGLTLRKVLSEMKDLGASSVTVASLLRKAGKGHEDLPVDYVGFDISDRFVVGYGLDLDGIGRNLKHIYALQDGA